MNIVPIPTVELKNTVDIPLPLKSKVVTPEPTYPPAVLIPILPPPPAPNK